jgi:hypothetical protein
VRLDPARPGGVSGATMRTSVLPTVLRLSLAAAVLPCSVAAQVVTADEGSFTVSRQGSRAGREEFRIMRQPVAGGVEFVARSVGAYGDRRITAALQTDATGAPLRYQVDVRNGADTESRLTGQIVRGRFSAQIRTARGEAASEFATGDGALLVDDEVYHHYFFLPLGGRLGGASADVPLLDPRRNAQGSIRVSREGSEAVAIGGESLAATKYQLSGPGTPARTVWLDASGRVLKVTVPSLGIVALRDDPPRR